MRRSLIAEIERIAAGVVQALRNPVALALSVVAFALVSAAVAVWLDRNDVPGRLARQAASMFDRGGPQDLVWRDVSSHYHELKVAEIQVGRAVIEGGSLAEVDGTLVIASPQGQLSYLAPDFSLHPLNAIVPMNMEALRQDERYSNPTFNLAALRTLDLLAAPAANGMTDLYVTHDRFAGDCIEFVVSRITLRAQQGQLTVIGDWADVWTARGCLRFSERGEALSYPPQSGGRMQLLSSEEILVAIGDYEHVGAGGAPVSMDTSNDFGKLIALNVRTGAARQFALGVRNPQGLAIDASGRIWETEHGPNGGDEINLVREGRNYGWPRVTYGMDYTSPPVRWPDSDAVASHDGYERPRLAFLPSIGIGSIAIPDATAFPNWARSLLVASLRAQSLFVVRTEGDDIVFAEPLELGHRLRDVIVRSDGSLAVLADGGTLLLLRNADSGPTPSAQIAGLEALPAPLPEEAPRADASPVELGQAYFSASCASCHSVSGESGIGPPLNGVVGRDIAGVEGFAYTDALRGVGGVWTEDRLRAFITDPNAIAAGTAMPAPHLRPRGPARIVDYLKTLRAERLAN